METEFLPNEGENTVKIVTEHKIQSNDEEGNSPLVREGEPLVQDNTEKTTQYSIRYKKCINTD